MRRRLLCSCSFGWCPCCALGHPCSYPPSNAVNPSTPSSPKQPPETTAHSSKALEAIKLLSGVGDPLTRRMLIFDALSGRLSTVKLRGRSAGCAACGPAATITRDSLTAYDYEAFTGQPANDGPPQPVQLIPQAERVTVQQLKAALEEARAAAAAASSSGPPPPWLLLDVRPAPQYAAVALPYTINVPYGDLERRLEEVKALCFTPPVAPPAEAGASSGSAGGGSSAGGAAAAAPALPHAVLVDGVPRRPVVVVCRRGISSQSATLTLRAAGVTWATDVVGGYTQYAQTADTSLPLL